MQYVVLQLAASLSLYKSTFIANYCYTYYINAHSSTLQTKSNHTLTSTLRSKTYVSSLSAFQDKKCPKYQMSYHKTNISLFLETFFQISLSTLLAFKTMLGTFPVNSETVKARSCTSRQVGNITSCKHDK